jgi:hypothetical protein
MTIRDSFRFMTKNGGEHIISLEAESYPELLSLIAEAEADVLQAGGVFLISNNLRPSFDLTKEYPDSNNPFEVPPLPPAPAPAPAAKSNEPRYEDITTELEPGTHKFPVKEVFKDVNQKGDKEFLKVVIDGDYKYGNGNWGIALFKGSDTTFPGWKNWRKGQRYSPPVHAGYVIVKDPQNGGKWADIVGFTES